MAPRRQLTTEERKQKNRKLGERRAMEDPSTKEKRLRLEADRHRVARAQETEGQQEQAARHKAFRRDETIEERMARENAIRMKNLREDREDNEELLRAINDEMIPIETEEERSYRETVLAERNRAGVPRTHLKNIDTRQGLCNGTRLIIKSLTENLIVANIASGKNKGHSVFLPRIFMSPTDSDLPFILKRLRFPVLLAFAMTINKLQGQAFDWVGIHLPEPVFGHGQLYVQCDSLISPM